MEAGRDRRWGSGHRVGAAVEGAGAARSPREIGGDGSGAGGRRGVAGNRRGWLVATACALLLVPFRSVAAETADPEAAVRAAEEAFAAAFAARDVEAFAALVAEDAVFSGGAETLRGRDAVVEGWRPMIEAAEAPFSWAPERVLVNASGDLAMTTGPVRNPAGDWVASFVSTWRREPDGTWRVIFDVGPRCPGG